MSEVPRKVRAGMTGILMAFKARIKVIWKSVCVCTGSGLQKSPVGARWGGASLQGASEAPLGPLGRLQALLSLSTPTSSVIGAQGLGSSVL